MAKEFAVGAGLAALAVALVYGWDITLVVMVAGLVLLVRFLMENRGGAGSRFDIVPTGGDGTASSITFDHIGGQEVAKRELVEALDFVRDAERVAHLGIRPLKGILLAGPPGTGKTLMAKAAANYTDSVFLSASGSQFVEVYAGVGAQRVRGLFRRARDLARRQGKKSAIVFIDEIEVLGGKRGAHSSHLEYDQTLNQLLVEMDGLGTTDEPRVLVVGATNRPDLLDSALMRPGRFDRIVNVELPDREGRLHILQIHTAGKPIRSDVDLHALARETYGFSGAHLEALVNEAAIEAMRQGRDEITPDDLREAVDKVMMGEKLHRLLQEDERRRIAYHEVGHALIGEWTRPGSVAAVTVTSRGRALGYVRRRPEDDQYLYTYEELCGQIDVLLAGAIAEELVFGSRSTGAAGDFEEAARLADRLIDAGMSSLGIVHGKMLPPQMRHEEIQAILEAREAHVKERLQAAEGTLHRIASVLLERERLEGDEFRSLMAAAQVEGSDTSPLGDVHVAS